MSASSAPSWDGPPTGDSSVQWKGPQSNQPIPENQHVNGPISHPATDNVTVPRSVWEMMVKKVLGKESHEPLLPLLPQSLPPSRPIPPPVLPEMPSLPNPSLSVASMQGPRLTPPQVQPVGESLPSSHVYSNSGATVDMEGGEDDLSDEGGPQPGPADIPGKVIDRPGLYRSLNGALFWKRKVIRSCVELLWAEDKCEPRVANSSQYGVYHLCCKAALTRLPGTKKYKRDPSICEAEVKASYRRRLGLWMVTYWAPTHTCDASLRKTVVPRAMMVAEETQNLVCPAVQDDPGSMKPKDLRKHFESSKTFPTNVQPRYHTTRRALMILQGRTPERIRAQFLFLPRLFVNIQAVDSRNIVNIRRDRHHRFEAAFLGLHASAAGYPHTRRIIFLDSTPRRRPNPDNLILMASTEDGEGRVFPLAMAIVPTTSYKWWKYFLTNLKKLIPALTSPTQAVAQSPPAPPPQQQAPASTASNGNEDSKRTVPASDPDDDSASLIIDTSMSESEDESYSSPRARGPEQSSHDAVEADKASSPTEAQKATTVVGKEMPPSLCSTAPPGSSAKETRDSQPATETSTAKVIVPVKQKAALWLATEETEPALPRDRFAGCILAGREDGLGKAISEVLPRVPHSYCALHLAAELSTSTGDSEKPKRLKKLMYNIAIAGDRVKRQTLVNNFHHPSCSEEARLKFESFDLDRYARGHFPYSRFGHVTASVVESLDKVFLENARELPIRDAFYHYYMYVHRLFEEAREKDSLGAGALTHSAETLFMRNVQALAAEKGRTTTVWGANLRFSSKHGQEEHTGSLRGEDRHCSCGDWVEYGVPCLHVLHSLQAASHIQRLLPEEADPRHVEWFHTSCRRSSLLRSYEANIDLVLRPDVPVRDCILHPPVFTPKRGRCKTTKDGGDAATLEHKCSNCNQIGHNCRSCDQPEAAPLPTQAQSAESSADHSSPGHPGAWASSSGSHADHPTLPFPRIVRPLGPPDQASIQAAIFAARRQVLAAGPFGPSSLPASMGETYPDPSSPEATSTGGATQDPERGSMPPVLRHALSLFPGSTPPQPQHSSAMHFPDPPAAFAPSADAAAEAMPDETAGGPTRTSRLVTQPQADPDTGSDSDSEADDSATAAGVRGGAQAETGTGSSNGLKRPSEHPSQPAMGPKRHRGNF
eukprot:Rmarinus@m.12538